MIKVIKSKLTGVKLSASAGLKPFFWLSYKSMPTFLATPPFQIVLPSAGTGPWQAEQSRLPYKSSPSITSPSQSLVAGWLDALELTATAEDELLIDDELLADDVAINESQRTLPHMQTLLSLALFLQSVACAP